jgi:cytochrome c-type biogenesis protein CcmH/NrfG
VRRSLALIAVAAAVAAAAAVVVAGMSSGDGAGASSSQATGTAGSLPSGHPSIAGRDTSPAPGDDSSPSADATTAAIAQLQSEADDDPGNVQVLLDLGDAYFMRQHLQQAEQAYTQALGRQPDNAAAQVGLAMVWHAQGDSKRAERALKSVLDSHPDDQDAHYSLAIIYFSNGRTDLAKQEWQAAARIDPSSVTGRRSQSFVDLIEGDESASPQAGN